MQTCESSSATASQEWRSLLMPSRPISSPAIWKPVTCSRPSSEADTHRLEEAGAHRVKRRKGLAGMEQALAAFDAAAGADHVVQRHHFVVRQAHRQTEFAQVAGRTGDLQCIDAGRWGGFMRHVGHYCIRNNSKN
jgi:hypothetical protein